MLEHLLGVAVCIMILIGLIGEIDSSQVRILVFGFRDRKIVSFGIRLLLGTKIEMRPWVV